MAKPTTITTENAAELLQPIFDAAAKDFQEKLEAAFVSLESGILEKAKALLEEDSSQEEEAQKEDSEGPIEAEDSDLCVRLEALEKAFSEVQKELSKASRRSNQPAKTASGKITEEEGFSVDKFVNLLTEK